jgi:MYXO-CTERM domain-containing protein
MNVKPLLLPLFLFAASPALALPARWTPIGKPERAVVTGGPWVLAEGTAAAPTATYPARNRGTNPFAPYYHAYVTGDDSLFIGYFDYRPKDLGEAVVAAASVDRGRSWYVLSQALTYTPPSDKPNDDGIGHPFALTVGGNTWLYGLDRSAKNVDSAGLVINPIAGDLWDPLAGAPDAATPGAPDLFRTEGLTHPDGIIDAIPRWDGSVQVLYLAKDTTVTPNVTSVHLATTFDGISFHHDRVVSGLVSEARPFIGPRGTVVSYNDGSYGLFFSAGLPGEDADAFHFIGYAESDDLLHWTVINDVEKPILSTEAAKDPTGGQPWYAGRVYAPSLVPSDDGCSGTLMFSGYKTIKPKNAPTDYRQIGRVELSLCGKRDSVGSTKLAGKLPPRTALHGAAGGCAVGGDASATGPLTLLLVAAVAVGVRRRKPAVRR